MSPPPASVAAAAAPRTPLLRTAWIDGPWRDLALYVATPLLLVPLILLRSGRPALEDLLLAAGAFGALGHHLPGMMRAYGDRALFRRFRWRFVVAPLFLVPVCVAFSVNDLGGVILITFFWTNWHSLMQIFGFARIYDAKVGNTGIWTARLDHALCVAWIGAPLLLGPSRLGSILEYWYGSGGPLLSAGFLRGLAATWQVATVLVTVVWLLHTLRGLGQGRTPNVAKLVLFVTSFGFWWFCMDRVDNLLLGVALFDIFHDVQYLALVWTFNKTRVLADRGVGAFSRYLFRGRLTLAGIYVGLVVAYGSLGYAKEGIDQELLRKSLIGVLAASALLHFYFDGFIWKVRERSTRAALSVAGGGEDIRLGGRVPGWAVHGGKWLFFVVPLGTMCWWDVHDQRPEREWREAIAAAVPESSEALTNLAATMDLGTERDRALELHRRAIRLKPTYPVAHNNLGVALFLTGQVDEAQAELEEAVRLYPGYAAAHRHLGTLFVSRGDRVRGAEQFRLAVEEDPRDAQALAGLGLLQAGRGEAAEAVASFERALRFQPDEGTALNALTWLLATNPDARLRDGERAVELAERLLQRGSGTEPLLLDTAAAAYAEAGRFDDALSTLDEALELARARGQEAVIPALQAHRDAYAHGEPWRG